MLSKYQTLHLIFKTRMTKTNFLVEHVGKQTGNQGARGQDVNASS